MRASALLPFLVVPALLSAQTRFDYARDIGIAATRAHGVTCIAMPAPQPAPGTEVVLADPRDSAAVVVAIVRARGASACPDEDVALADSLQPVSIIGGVRPSLGSFWFVLRTPARTMRAANAAIVGDLDGDGTPEQLRVCTSMEGLHFTIWAGPPLVGVRRWARYVPLFYDVDPSCDERDFSDP